MKASLEVELKPFATPNFVLLESKVGGEPASVPLSALDSLTLDRLCEQFRSEVFKKAGKPQPPQDKGSAHED